MITVSFMARNLYTAKPAPNGLTFQIQRYKNAAMGGPYSAEIRATGSDAQLWELLDFLRCPVFLTSEQGDDVWWGYVSEVELIARNPYSTGTAKVRFGINLDSMYNRVAVAWEDIAVGTYGGERETTAWVSDSLSQTEYGVKEGLYSGSSASDLALAEQARDTLLSQKRFPVPSIDLNYSGTSEAFIRCRGWWDTMNWKYCTVPVELALAYSTSGLPPSTNYGFGTVAIESIAQGILPTGGDINLATVSIYLRTAGAPTDDLTVSVYSNPDDITPTVNLGTSASVSAGDVTASYTWVNFVFSPEVTLTSGTKYFLVIERSGAMDNTNYYQTQADSGGYLPGTFSFYDGAVWANATYDIGFQLFDNDIVLTSTQLLSMCTDFGQFFSFVESTVNSGLTSESYRDGDGSALFEAEELLQHGTVRDRRMLVKVDAARRCTIYEEPENTPINYYRLFSNSSMEDAYGAPIRKELATCGVYARLVDVIPPSVNTTIMGSASIRFIETAEYEISEDRIIYQARDELDPLTVGRALDG